MNKIIFNGFLILSCFCSVISMCLFISCSSDTKDNIGKDNSYIFEVGFDNQKPDDLSSPDIEDEDIGHEDITDIVSITDTDAFFWDSYEIEDNFEIEDYFNIDISQEVGSDVVIIVDSYEDVMTGDDSFTDVLAGDDSFTVMVDNSIVLKIELPSKVGCNEQFSGYITMKNTGNTVWTDDVYKLGAVGDSDPFINGEPRVWLKKGTKVNPEESYSFQLNLTAPSTPGIYTTQWQMVHEFVRWFGEIASYNISVECSIPVDSSTISGKLLMGYQGWFYCKGDGSPVNEWVHWFKSQTPDASNIRVDLFPDLSEFDSDELFDTQMKFNDGSTVKLYSSYHPKTISRHFKWMRDYGIDGILLQRFISELKDPRFLSARNSILTKVRDASELYGRVFAIEYDISGANESTLVEDIKNDWKFIVENLKITESSRYLKHNNKPVLFIWGLGFNDRPGTPGQARELIDWFKKSAPQNQIVTLGGGVPTYWRTLTANTDTKTDPEWASVYRSFDIINPWMVGRFSNEKQADNFKNSIIVPDIAECKKYNIVYMPVVFPGFSWHNMNRGTSNESPLNLIPRNGGKFYWRQVYNTISAGVTTIFNAMFDEVDEGTAMMKAVSRVEDLPTGADFVYLNIDGYSLPSDFYLELAGKATKMLRGEIPLTEIIP